MEFSHKPVLLQQTIEALAIRPEGIYVDGTAGGGGHSAAILERLSGGRLICVDQDPDAIAVLQERFAGKDNVSIVRSNFSEMTDILSQLTVAAVDGVLLDIGVSSHQLDTAERGFSYHYEAPLDMRMSQSGRTAADLVNTLSYQELAHILFTYGEEKFAKQIARAIERERAVTPITTTLQLAEIVKAAYPPAKRHDKHPARKTFQALRIAVNEDRMVKQRMASWCTGCTSPKDFPVCVCGKTPSARLVLRKPAEASVQELNDNPRSRSAKLRCCEKIKEPE